MPDHLAGPLAVRGRPSQWLQRKAGRAAGGHTHPVADERDPEVPSLARALVMALLLLLLAAVVLGAIAVLVFIQLPDNFM